MRQECRGGRAKPEFPFRLRWLRVTALILLSFWVTFSPSAESAPPNIVLILADDLGWNDLGYHGSEIETPHLDALAETGVQLERFYVQPFCSPTRASVMTGKSSARLGIYQPISKLDPGGLPLEETLLPEVLAESGYQSVMVGKWHLGHGERAYFPNQRGFEHFYGNLTGGIGYWDHNHGGGHDWQRNGMTVREEGYATRLIADEAVRLVELRDHDRPLFLLASFNAPHLPNEAPPASLDGYPETIEGRRRIHAGMVSELDRAVGRILKALSQEGIRDNTLIWFFSDNGGLNASAYPEGLVTLMETLVNWFGEPLPIAFLEFVRGNVQEGASDNGPLRGGKGDVYEGGIRVPSLLAWPGEISSGQSNAFVTAEDVLPTLLQAVGLSGRIPADLNGRSRWRAIVNDEQAAPMDSGSHPFRVQGLGGVALIDPPWKLVLRNAFPPWVEAPTELYNIQEDPSEQENVAAGNPDRVQALTDLLDAQSLGPSQHAPYFRIVMDPDAFGGPEDRGPWAEAAD